MLPLLLLNHALAADPTWTVTVDPLTTALGFVHLQVEHAFAPGVSVYASPSLRLYDGVFGFPTGPFVGYGAEAGVRVFVWGNAPEGAWLMGRGVLAGVTTKDPERAWAVGGYTSALAGYTAVLGPGLVLSGGLGVSWFDYGVAAWGIHGVLPAAHTNIGWAF